MFVDRSLFRVQTFKTLGVSILFEELYFPGFRKKNVFEIYAHFGFPKSSKKLSKIMFTLKLAQTRVSFSETCALVLILCDITNAS